MRQKLFDGISWYSPPPLIQTFSVPEVTATVKDSPTEIFGTLRQKKCRRKIWYPPPSYPNFSATGNQCNSKGFPYGNFGTVRQKIFDGKSWYSPPPLSINFFATGNFLKHSTEGFTCEYFRHCETKNFWRKILILPPLLQTFSVPGINATIKDSPTEIFGTVRQKKISTENRDINLWSINFFDTRNFLKHQRAPLRSFSVLWHKTILTEHRDTLLHKVQKSVVKLMFVKTLWKLNSKQ